MHTRMHGYAWRHACVGVAWNARMHAFSLAIYVGKKKFHRFWKIFNFQFFLLKSRFAFRFYYYFIIVITEILKKNIIKI